MLPYRSEISWHDRLEPTTYNIERAQSRSSVRRGRSARRYRFLLGEGIRTMLDEEGRTRRRGSGRVPVIFRVNVCACVRVLCMAAPLSCSGRLFRLNSFRSIYLRFVCFGLPWFRLVTFHLCRFFCIYHAGVCPTAGGAEEERHGSGDSDRPLGETGFSSRAGPKKEAR